VELAATLDRASHVHPPTSSEPSVTPADEVEEAGDVTPADEEVEEATEAGVPGHRVQADTAARRDADCQLEVDEVEADLEAVVETQEVAVARRTPLDPTGNAIPDTMQERAAREEAPPGPHETAGGLGQQSVQNVIAPCVIGPKDSDDEGSD
jgi:hypothetical protein